MADMATLGMGDVLDDDLVSAAQIAVRLQISVRTVWRLVERGVLREPIRFNRKLVRWRKKWVDAALAGLDSGPVRGVRERLDAGKAQGHV
jgi:predicted DNA-binding transcriptional regulator AlpA